MMGLNLSWLAGTTTNKTYQVYVAAYIDGSWGAYGESCTVTVPAAGIQMAEDDLEKEKISKISKISMETYPNPNNGEFKVKTSRAGQFHIVNELGQIIHSFESSKELNFETKISGLQVGMYFVTGTIDNETITKKVIVTK